MSIRIVADGARQRRKAAYGRPLTNPQLRPALDNIIKKFVTKASNYVSLSSTQPNESFNQLVSSKAPKAKYVIKK